MLIGTCLLHKACAIYQMQEHRVFPVKIHSATAGQSSRRIQLSLTDAAEFGRQAGICQRNAFSEDRLVHEAYRRGTASTQARGAATNWCVLRGHQQSRIIYILCDCVLLVLQAVVSRMLVAYSALACLTQVTCLDYFYSRMYSVINGLCLVIS